MVSVGDELTDVCAKTIYESSPIGLAVADLEGRLIQANPAYRSLVGARAVIGHPALDDLLEEGITTTSALVDDLVHGRQAEFMIENRRVRVESPSGWIRTTVLVMRGDAEEPLALLITIEDITDRKHLEAVGDRIFELSGDLIGVVSTDGYFRRVSRSMSDVLGWSEEELLASPWLSFIHPDDRERSALEAERILMQGEQTFNFEVRFLCKDGSSRHLSASGSPDVQAGLIYSVLVDITERRQNEADRQELEKAKLREKQALEINDTIVQGLAASKMALEMDMSDKALDLIGGTLRTARSIVSTLLSSGAIEQLRPGDLRRGGAARIESME